jgi:hypothetical protein
MTYAMEYTRLGNSDLKVDLRLRRQRVNPAKIAAK